MIFKISEPFAKACPAPDLSEVCCLIIKNRHFLVVNSHVRQLIRASIVQHGSTKQKQLFKEYHGFNPTLELRNYLTTINVDEVFPLSDLYYLATEAALLVVENSHNEWKIYKELTAYYAKQSEFSNLFELLRIAQEKKLIDALHAGGWSSIKDVVEDHAYIVDSGNLADKKLVSLFDRDTNDANSYDGNKNALFKFFNHGIDYLHIQESDVYSLSQTPKIWHMWCKRAIENYFPDLQYETCGIDISDLQACDDRDYYKFEDNHPRGYKKAILSDLTNNLDLSEFNAGQKRFRINGKDMSEFELFLLKMVRTI